MSTIDIGIPQDQRKAVVAGLARVPADRYALYLKTHGLHWTATAPMFQTLHVMFEEHYNEMWVALDQIAERIRALGEFAPSSGSQMASMTRIPEADGVPAALDMVQQLVEGHEQVIRTAREAFPAAEAAGDESTADLLTQRLQVHEKTAWMLRSLLQ